MPKDIGKQDVHGHGAEDPTGKDRSYKDWMRLTEGGKPTKKQIAAYDAQHGPTRRGKLTEIFRRKGVDRPKWQG